MKTSLNATLLESLLESAQFLHSSLDLDHLLKHLLRTVMGRRLVSKGLIAVSEGGTLRLALARGLAGLRPGQPFEEESARQAGIEKLYKIKDGDELVGLMGLGRAMRSGDSSEEEFLKALLGIAASGIGNARSHAEAKRLNRDLDQNLQDLQALLEMVQSLTSILNPDDVARLLALTLAGRWGVSRYAVTAWKEGHPQVVRQRGLTLPDPDALRKAADGIQQAVRVEDLEDGDLKKALKEQKGALAFPLRSKDALTGLAVLGTRLGGLQFSDQDLRFGAGLAAQAVVALENGWHFHESLEKRKMEQEIELAASIQKDLFPAQLPELEGFESAAFSRAARQVGGDYYDVLPAGEALPENTHLFCVADVSGKGIPASLLMSSIQATLRALIPGQPSLVSLVSRTSELLYATTPASKYATAILARIEPQTGAVTCVNAGHNDGLLLSPDGKVDHWKSTGPPLGLIPGIPFQESRFELAPGDLLALYSDGVVEAQNSSEEEFEEERLVRCLQAHRGKPAAEIIDLLFEEIDAFAAGHPQHDDITVMLVKRLAEGH